ncbi:hypothetical protein ACTXT7_017141 [Hymenolepis weldensis]
MVKWCVRLFTDFLLCASVRNTTYATTSRRYDMYIDIQHLAYLQNLKPLSPLLLRGSKPGALSIIILKLIV